MDGEHHAMSDALDETAAAMEQYAGTGSAADAAAARASVEQTRHVVDRHLSHEEEELEPLMVPHLETAEWKQVDKALRKSSPVAAGQFFAWLTDEMDPASRAYVDAAVPRPVLFLLSRVLGRGYQRDVAPVWR